jgi:hypothetical protein
MRTSIVWNTLKQVRLEKSLITLPRRERIQLRGFVAGKRTK